MNGPDDGQIFTEYSPRKPQINFEDNHRMLTQRDDKQIAVDTESGDPSSAVKEDLNQVSISNMKSIDMSPSERATVMTARPLVIKSNKKKNRY